MKASVARLVRPQDFVWLLLFSALAYVSTNRYGGIPFLLVLAALQVLEPKVEYFATPQGNIVSILLKLVISYVLIGVTGGSDQQLLPDPAAAAGLGSHHAGAGGLGPFHLGVLRRLCLVHFADLSRS